MRRWCSPAASNLLKMTVIKLAAIVLNKLMHQRDRLGESSISSRRTDDDTVMMHSIAKRSVEEAYRIRTSRLSIALTFTIFFQGYLSRRFIGNGGERARQKSGFFPRIKNHVCSREKLVWCPSPPAPRPTLLFLLSCPSHAHAVSVLLAKFIRRWNGQALHKMSHMLTPCSDSIILAILHALHELYNILERVKSEGCLNS